MNYPDSFEELIECFKMLPGIGNKGAERMVYHLLEMDVGQVTRFSNAMISFKKKIHYCKKCGHICEDDYCDICKDTSRNQKQICVVESPKDVFAMEKLKEYHGLYHVLGGTISIMDGTTMDDLNIKTLLEKADDQIEEVIIATNPTREGETTALFLAKLLEKKNVNVTRIANGLPIGSSLDYADELTLLRSFEGRKKL
ncbi:MAG: recombination mediator RecR [Eggerthia catenaformis]|uniref:recombination mediator RecR n=1 Tax=Eggerthia catenaformis TaxID=31973 RepID=UPI000A3B0F7F|nr:recombination protein RecR [Eggerthia catenaformis]